MRYIVGWLYPPLAILSCGKPFQAILLSLPVWLLGIVCLVFPPIGLVILLLAAIHGYIVVHGYYADRRTDRIVEAIERSRY